MDIPDGIKSDGYDQTKVKVEGADSNSSAL